MSSSIKESFKMKVFPKGQVVIPATLRKKYHIEIGDRIDVIAGQDGILLKPNPDNNRHKSLTDQLFGIFSNFADEKRMPTKADIEKATDKGFTEGWAE